jgi:hypothetical protein
MHGTGEKWVKVWKENLKRKGCVEDVHIIVSVGTVFYWFRMGTCSVLS